MFVFFYFTHWTLFFHTIIFYLNIWLMSMWTLCHVCHGLLFGFLFYFDSLTITNNLVFSALLFSYFPLFLMGFFLFFVSHMISSPVSYCQSCQSRKPVFSRHLTCVPLPYNINSRCLLKLFYCLQNNNINVNITVYERFRPVTCLMFFEKVFSSRSHNASITFFVL